LELQFCSEVAATMTDSLTLDALIHKAEGELDWQLLLERIAGFAVSAPAVQSILALQPEAAFEAACNRMRQTEAILDLLMSGDTLPIEDVPDTAEILERIERGTIVTGLELRDLQYLLDKPSACARLPRSSACGDRCWRKPSIRSPRWTGSRNACRAASSRMEPYPTQLHPSWPGCGGTWLMRGAS
jgi:hypothetical protein